jgi:hypothetical protein
MEMHPTQTVTEMALMRAAFYRSKSPDELRDDMRRWVSQGVDLCEITFWETRSARFRMICCDVAGISRKHAGTAWAHMTEENRQSIRAALRELKTVIHDGMNWRKVEQETRRGVA